jgi:hypothetical protein
VRNGIENQISPRWERYVKHHDQTTARGIPQRTIEVTPIHTGYPKVRPRHEMAEQSDKSLKPTKQPAIAAVADDPQRHIPKREHDAQLTVSNGRNEHDTKAPTPNAKRNHEPRKQQRRQNAAGR